MPDPDTARPAIRAFWSGTITFGLVSIPVDLFAAVHARQTAMKMVDDRGRPLGRRYYVQGEGELSAEQIVRGYETDSGEMVLVTDQELDAAAPEMSRDIELERFVPLEDIPAAYFQRPYFLAPAGRSTKAYHLLAETMQRAGRVGIGSFVMRGHQYLVAIVSEAGVLRAETLRFADELRAPADVGLPERAHAPPERVKAWSKAIEPLVRDRLDMEELADRYAGALRELAHAKAQKGEDVVSIGGLEDEEEHAGAEVVDLVKLLRERLAGAAPARRNTARQRKDPVRKAAGEPDLQSLSKRALQERAKALGIGHRSRMSKADLIRAIRSASNAAEARAA